jgi:hypothetical protein
MKQNTHAYLAWKAIQLAKESVENTVDTHGKLLAGQAKTAARLAAKEMQHRLRYYQDVTSEAAWVPDAVLKDMNPYHVFKLVTQAEFPGHDFSKCDEWPKDGVTYYRFSGGLPYRVDHIAQDIISMCKLRQFNDQFTLRQAFYHYLLLSHYVVDAHVPMHCDLRDDPPTDANDRVKPQGLYLSKNMHGDLEGLWDKAVSPLAIAEGAIVQTSLEEAADAGPYGETVKLDFKDCKKGAEIRPPTIAKSGLMDFMIDICIESKKRSLQLFAIDNPQQRNDAILPQMTREIFTTAVADLIAIWRYIWAQCQME